MAATGEQKRTTPGWMDFVVEGMTKPPEPKRDEFKKGFDALIDKKKKLFEEQNKVRDQLTAKFENVAKMSDADRDKLKELRAQLAGIQGERSTEREKRQEKSDGLNRLRTQKQQLENQLQSLTEDLGVFRDLDEIEEVIHHLHYRMETGGSSLKNEKKTIKRLSQLEEAKSLIQRIQPLTEKLDELNDQHDVMQGEFKDIMDRIKAITEKHNEQYEALNKQKNAATPKNDPNFQKDIDRLKEERVKIGDQITAANADIDSFRAAYKEKQDAWDAWKVKAQAGFRAQVEKERAERRAKYEAIEKERKDKERRARKEKKMNPKALEIDLCDRLITFVKQKGEAAKRDAAERERKQKIAAFDPTAEAAKLGMVLMHDDGDDGGLKPKKKQAQKKPKAPANGASNGAKAASEKIHVSEENKKAFARVEVAAPETLGQLEATKTALEAALKKFEGMKKSVDDCSSDDEPAEAAEEGDESVQPKDKADVIADQYESERHDRPGKDSEQKAGTQGSTKVHSVRAD